MIALLLWSIIGGLLYAAILDKSTDSTSVLPELNRWKLLLITILCGPLSVIMSIPIWVGFIFDSNIIGKIVAWVKK